MWCRDCGHEVVEDELYMHEGHDVEMVINMDKSDEKEAI